MIKFTDQERANEITKEIAALRKELYSLAPEYQVAFEPSAYDTGEGDYVLIKVIADDDDTEASRLSRCRVKRFNTREEGEAYIDFYKKEISHEA